MFTLTNEGILQVTARDPDTGVEQSSVLAVSSTLQKTFKEDLIQIKKPAPKKEAQKVITRTVTREVKFKAAEATPSPAPSPAKKADISQPKPPASSTPSPVKAASGSGTTGPRPATPGGQSGPQPIPDLFSPDIPETPAPPPAPKAPPVEEKPGLMARVLAFLKRPLFKKK